MDGVPECLHPMGLLCPCKRLCQGITVLRQCILRGCPHPGHEMRFGLHITEASIFEALVNVITDEIAVIGLVKNASEIVHGNVELWRILQLH